VLVMSTDIRCAAEIGLDYDGAKGELATVSVLSCRVGFAHVRYVLRALVRPRGHKAVATRYQRHNDHLARSDTQGSRVLG
jgi:hypothetical protein